MVYYINYIDTKNSHKGLETSADSIEDLFNQLIHRRDIASIDEIVELEDNGISSKDDDELEDWIALNRV